MSDTITRLFDEIFAATKETIQAAKKTTIERKIKRKLESAYDDAEGKIIEAEEKIDTLQRDFNSFDVNAILKEEYTIVDLKSVQEKISTLHKKLFNDTIRTK